MMQRWGLFKMKTQKEINATSYLFLIPCKIGRLMIQEIWGIPQFKGKLLKKEMKSDCGWIYGMA